MTKSSISSPCNLDNDTNITMLTLHSSHFRCWRLEFLDDLELLLEERIRRITQIKYSSFLNTLLKAIQCLRTIQSLHRDRKRSERHIDELLHQIDEVSCHIQELIECDRRYISYCLVADSFHHSGDLFAWNRDVHTHLQDTLSKCERSSRLLGDLSSNVAAFQEINHIVQNALREAYEESLPSESIQRQLKYSKMLEQNDIDADYNDDSINIYDLMEHEEESSTLSTTMYSSMNLNKNKKVDLGSNCTPSTCSMSASTLPDHYSWTEDSLSQDKLVKCFRWYGRMGQPNKQDMKRFIVKAHPDITADDIDKLPWKSNGRRLDMSLMTLHFLREDFNFSFASNCTDDALMQLES